MESYAFANSIVIEYSIVRTETLFSKKKEEKKQINNYQLDDIK